MEINRKSCLVDRYEELRQTALVMIVWASVPRIIFVKVTLIYFTRICCDSWHLDQRSHGNLNGIYSIVNQLSSVCSFISFTGYTYIHKETDHTHKHTDEIENDKLHHHSLLVHL